MPNATARPWKVEELPVYFRIRNHEGTYVMEMVNGRGMIRTKEDARLIVQAVNSYDAMKAALENCEKALTLARLMLINGGGDPMPTVDAIITDARAALALAESETKCPGITLELKSN